MLGRARVHATFITEERSSAAASWERQSSLPGADMEKPFCFRGRSPSCFVSVPGLFQTDRAAYQGRGFMCYVGTEKGFKAFGQIVPIKKGGE